MVTMRFFHPLLLFFALGTQLQSGSATQLDDPFLRYADDECSLNGYWNSTEKKCRCRPAWSGEYCHELNLHPARVAFKVPGYTTWGSTVVQDESTGMWHMFVAKYITWQHYNPFSHIVHATSSNLEGPYRQVEELPGLGTYHCSPAVLKIPNPQDKSKSLYVLYASGVNTSKPGNASHPNVVQGGMLTIAATTNLDETMKVIATNTSQFIGNPSIVPVDGGFFFGADGGSNSGTFFSESFTANDAIPTASKCKGEPTKGGMCTKAGTWYDTENPRPDYYYLEDNRHYQDKLGNFHFINHALGLSSSGHQDSDNCMRKTRLANGTMAMMSHCKPHCGGEYGNDQKCGRPAGNDDSLKAEDLREMLTQQPSTLPAACERSTNCFTGGHGFARPNGTQHVTKAGKVVPFPGKWRLFPLAAYNITTLWDTSDPALNQTELQLRLKNATQNQTIEVSADRTERPMVLLDNVYGDPTYLLKGWLPPPSDLALFNRADDGYLAHVVIQKVGPLPMGGKRSNDVVYV